MVRSVRAWQRGESGVAAAWLQAALLRVLEPLSDLPVTGYRDLNRFLDTARDELQVDPAAAPAVHELAGGAGVTNDHFTRSFRNRFGVTPKEYALRQRLTAAEELLLGSSLPIREIAQRLGYRDQAYFSKQFRLRVGTTPSAFRRGIHSPPT